MSKRIKLNYNKNYSRRLQRTLAGNPPPEVELERPPGGTGQPHLGVSRPLVVGLTC
jgi:hypothetical protein